MLYHITTSHDWYAAQTAGEYRHASLDTDGYIHFSTAAQIEDVANNFFASVTDLLLLHIDEALLTAELRYDDSQHPNGSTQPFPHLYGPLNLRAVVHVTAVKRDMMGRFHLA